MLSDLRYALRGFLRTPTFAVVAILTLALGIGANTAIFSVVNAVLLRPLPYADAGPAGQCPAIAAPDGPVGSIGCATSWICASAAGRSTRWRPSEDALTVVAAASGEAERVPAVRVSANYFDMLGVRPALGRTFTADDDRPGQWRVRAAERWALGAPVRRGPARGRATVTDERSCRTRIIGVMPAGFEPRTRKPALAAEIGAALADRRDGELCVPRAVTTAGDRPAATGITRRGGDRGAGGDCRQHLGRRIPAEDAAAASAIVPLQ